MEGDMETALRQLDYTKPQQVKELGDRIREQGYRRVHQLLEWHHSADKEMSRRADAVLIELGPLPFGVLSDATSDQPAQLVWEMQLMTDVHLQQRQWLSQKLDDMLGDTTALPQEDLSSAFEESAPPPRRVCDEAYLMLRHVLAGEGDERFMINSDGFLNLTAEERDEEIKRVRETREWKLLVEPWAEDDSVE